MIKIQRSSRDANGDPIVPGAPWTARAQQETVKARGGAGVSRAVYAHQRVKVALEELFHGKCAYCESDLSRWDWDVEHFRPKGRVFEREDHPGYYWLAYDWENLYPSCTRCNQKRKAQPTWAGHSGTAGGKADRFPLSSETSRAMGPPAAGRRLRHGLNGEKTLLLDPCSDNPSDHFAFDALGFIRPRRRSKQASTSIDVFNLNEPRLARARSDRIKEVVKTVRLFLASKPGDPRALFNRIVKIFEGDSSPYAGAVRHIRRDPRAFGIDI